MKKFLAMFLALLMLALPALSLAEGDFISEAVESGRRVERTTTFSVSSLGDETVDQILGELLGALNVATSWQEGNAPQGGLHVVMNGKDILSFEFAAANEKIYLKSDLLSGQTVVFANGDEQPITENILNTLVSMGILKEEDAAQAREQMNAAMAGAQNPMADVDFEAIAEGFDFTELVKLGEDVAGRMAETTDLSGKPGDCDPAVKAITVTLTAEDIVKFYDVVLDALKANKEYLALLDTMMVSVNDEPTTAEDALNQMRQVIDQDFAKMLTSDVPVTVYLDGDDQPVAAVMAFTMNAAQEGEEARPAAVDFVYKRNTDGERVLHSVLYAIEMTDGKVTASLDVAVEGSDVDAEFMVNDGEGGVSVGFKKTSEVTDTEKTLNVRVGVGAQDLSMAATYVAHATKSGADAEQTTVVTLINDGEELATMTTVSKTTDPAASIVTDDAIRLAELNQEEFQNWFMGVIGNLQTWLLQALQALPTSVLMMFMQ